MQTDAGTPLSSLTRRSRASGPSHRDLALGAFSHTEPFPEAAAPSVLHEIFEETSRRFPEHVAIEHQGHQLTYAALDALAERVADGLRERAVGPGHRVAIQLERSIETHATLLGVLKAGAAYVPLDVECPEDRVRFVLADSGASLLVRASPLKHVPCREIDFGQLTAAVTRRPQRQQATAHDPCYVIYTSGSTGRPKGVEIAHRSAAHLVRVEHRMFGLSPHDRVLQGFSLSFDAAVEEIWLAFASGAALVVVDKPTLLESFAEVVTNRRITVVSTVPTVLATVQRSMHCVRLLIVGGEACPPSLVERWSRGRRMVNTYGPTEATVIATATDLRAGEPVTIGKPIANYRVYLLDAQRQPVPPGKTGEIYIGGPGLALGYIGHAAALPSRFVSCPFAGELGAPARLYATGDLGRHTASGDIEFLGRVDQQIKLRGVRIELGEIEEALGALEGVAQCCVAKRRLAGQDALVAYVVLRDSATFDPARWSRLLHSRLPAAMVPAQFQPLARLPTLASGKVDRSSLPEPREPSVSSIRPSASEGLEHTLACAFAEVTGAGHATPEQDFFLDLGGHSLLAAQLISRLRCDPALGRLSLRDLYDHPTAAKLAQFIASRHAATADAASPTMEAPRSVAVRAMIAQAAGVYWVAALHAAQWLGPYLAFLALRRGDGSILSATAVSLGALLVVHPLMLLVAAAVKWLVVGRYRAGVFPLWGQAHFRHWLVDRVLAIAPVESLRGTPLLNVYLRLLGARVGRGVMVATTNLNAFDLIAVGDDTTLSVDAQVRPAIIRGGKLVIGEITIGARSVVGTRATLGPGSKVADDTDVAPLAHGGGEEAQGQLEPRPKARVLRFVTAILGLQLLPMLAILPGLVVLERLERWGTCASLLALPAVALSFVVLVCAQLVALKRALGKTSPGTHSWDSAAYFKHWLFAQAQRSSLDWVGSLYATVFTPWLYRLLGAKVGAHAEVSTAVDFDPDLLEIEADSFVADVVALGAPHLARGKLALAHTRIERGAFVGNGAVVPTGASVGAGSLVGCMSLAPLQTPARSSWMGAPPLRLARRQESARFSPDTTFRPSRRLFLCRALIELARVIAPTTGVILFVHALVALGALVGSTLGGLALVGLFPGLYLALAALVAGLVIAAKWLLVGCHRQSDVPLWCTFVWRTEFITALHENLVDPLLNEFLKGTVFLPWFFRALGAKVGKGVTMMTTGLTEYDLVQIGDGACLDNDCTLQTHLFEDRVMKMSTVRVGAGCTVGAGSVVLYETTMARGSVLEPGSLLMKGETLPPASAWVGIPAASAEPVLRTSRREAGVVERLIPYAAAAAFALALGSASTSRGTSAHDTDVASHNRVR